MRCWERVAARVKVGGGNGETSTTAGSGRGSQTCRVENRHKNPQKSGYFAYCIHRIIVVVTL